MVERVKRVSQRTVRKIENAYCVLAMVCTVAAAVKVATLPKVHSSIGQLPVWQVIAGVMLAGILYEIFKLIDKES